MDPEERLNLGSHLSVAGGAWKALDEAIELELTSLQIFTKNASRWVQKPIDPAAIEKWHAGRARWEEGAPSPRRVVSHTSYLINLGSPKDELFEKSCAALTDELARAGQLGLHGVVQHPGAHVGSGVEAGIARIAEGARRALDATEGGPKLLLETTAGAGSTIGRTFEELRDLVAQIDRPGRVAVCLDTCHLYASGYDLRDADAYAATMTELEAHLDLSLVECWHLNDSRGELGSNLDRHEHIGEGRIGVEGFRLLLDDPRFHGVPNILETAKEDDGARRNLAVLRALVEA
ncbi:MAG: deoxyribonuclease IV [Planctomycetota bacterium]